MPDKLRKVEKLKSSVVAMSQIAGALTQDALFVPCGYFLAVVVIVAWLAGVCVPGALLLLLSKAFSKVVVRYQPRDYKPIILVQL